MELKPVEAKEIPVAQTIYNTGWAIVKKYYNITEDNEEAWEALVNDANALYKTGIDTATRKLSEAMALGVLDYIEQISKERGTVT